MPIQVVGHCIDDLPRDLRTAWSIEIGDFVSFVDSLQRWEMRPDLAGGDHGQRRSRDCGSGQLGFKLLRGIQGQLPLITFATI